MTQDVGVQVRDVEVCGLQKNATDLPGTKRKGSPITRMIQKIYKKRALKVGGSDMDEFDIS